MPWSVPNVVEQRTEFVLRSFETNVNFATLCRDFGISRKTGYKWRQRFEAEGFAGLHDQSRRPHGHSASLPEEVVCELVRLKTAHPGWGPRKICELYATRHSQGPSESSVKRVLGKAGLTEKRRRPRRTTDSGRLTARRKPTKPNEVWTVDFKGWWPTSRGKRCEPLTIRDEHSRYMLAVDALSTTKGAVVKACFERAFARYGLPEVIRSDNGTPFASASSPLGISRLSAWWLMLGIDLDRIQPGRPDQNGGHERMHRDIKRELQGKIEGDLRDHQAAFDVWRKEFNHVRPHEAINMKRPAELYEKSCRKLPTRLLPMDYSPDMLTRCVGPRGTISIENVPIFLTASLGGWTVGLKPAANDCFDLWFAHLRLGVLDLSSQRVTWTKPLER